MMNTLQSRLTKLVAIGLTLAIMQAFLGAGRVRAASVVSTLAAPTGRLVTAGDVVVSVGGAEARTGETIFTGQQIRTPAGAGASIYLSGLGRVDLSPATNVTLDFAPARVGVRLEAGCVILSAEKGVDGAIETKDATERTDRAAGSTVDVCTDGSAGATVRGMAAIYGAGAGVVPQDGNQGDDDNHKRRRGAWGLFGLGTKGTVLLLTAAGVGTGLIIFAATRCARGRNLSPGVPRGANDCQDS